jgi:putative heme-binding domain-containing protein
MLRAAFRVTWLAVGAWFLAHPPAIRSQTPAPVENVSSLPPRTPAEERKALHAPPGFDIQLVAAEPDIHKPLNLAFDDRGRLWVTDTVEYPFPKPAGVPGRDSVKILSNFQADGRASTIETFATGLNIPIGLLPYPSAREAIVHNTPNIYLMNDQNGDGRADTRQVMYGVFGNRDTHGMTNAFSWGFDGWIYACHGFANDSSVQGSDHRPIRMNSGNTYRMRPDGSHAEYVTHGQVNPFGLAFDPLGNLYSCDCHSRPVYQLLKGAWYPSFGKPDDGLGFGPEMVTHDHGSTGIAGISYYAADQFPEPYRNTIFIGNVVTNRVNHDRILWHGSTPQGIEQPDFVWSEDNWFRPVDIELGPDGALYVADFYNRIIGHYEVPLKHPGRDRERGRIWRIVYRGDRAAPPLPTAVDRTRSSPAELIADLRHPNLAVRLTAANQLVARGPDTLHAIRAIVGSETPARQRVHGLWVLSRLQALNDETLQSCMSDPDRELRVHALKTLVDRQELTAHVARMVQTGLRDPDPFVRRAAAEVLGAHPALVNVRPLLALRQSTPPEDTHLLHVVRMALRDQLRSPAAWQGVDSLGLTGPEKRAIADVATGVASAGSAAFLLAHLSSNTETPENLGRFAHHIARWAELDGLGALDELAARSAGRDLRGQAELLKSIHQGLQERGAAPSKSISTLAAAAAATLLESGDPEQARAGVDLARSLQLKEVQAPLRKLVQQPAAPLERRQAALIALVAIDPAGNQSLVSDVLRDAAAPSELREAAADQLASMNRPGVPGILADALPTAPERLQTAIAAALARRRDGARKLLENIAAGKASARVLQDQRVDTALRQSNPPRLDEQLKALLAGLPPADQKLSSILALRKSRFHASSREPGLGVTIFEKHCGICHQLGGKGSKVGPQLDGIGSRGVDRLIEDILDPNRNVDQSFRATILALKNGQIVSGLLLREEGEVLVLADATGKEVRVPKASVDDRQMSPLSPMPANLADSIGEDDFFRLLAYLLSKREATGPAPPKP